MFRKTQTKAYEKLIRTDSTQAHWLHPAGLQPELSINRISVVLGLFVVIPTSSVPVSGKRSTMIRRIEANATVSSLRPHLQFLLTFPNSQILPGFSTSPALNQHIVIFAQLPCIPDNNIKGKYNPCSNQHRHQQLFASSVVVANVDQPRQVRKDNYFLRWVPLRLP